MYLEKINGPEDVKKLNLDELNILAEEIREGLFNRLTKIGGHFGPNFFLSCFWFTIITKTKS